MSDQKRTEGMNEEIEITHADDLEETEEVVVFTKEEFEALIADCPLRTRKMTRKKAMKIRRIPFSINSSC